MLPNGDAALLSETLDACTHRFDAWVSSLAAWQLDEVRTTHASGIRLGGYGWLDQVRPSAQWEPVPAPQGVTGQVFRAATNMGFVQAPSLTHAATAAVLRSGYLSHREHTNDTETSDNPFAVDLSSDRVRRAEWLLQGVREGQSLSALLGYRFERQLHEHRLDHHIQRFRTLAAIKNQDEIGRLYAEVASKERLFREVQALRDQAVEASESATAFRGERAVREQTRDTYQNTIDRYLQLEQKHIPNAAQATVAAQSAAGRHRMSKPQTVFITKSIDKPNYGNIDILENAELLDETDVDTWHVEQSRLDREAHDAKVRESELRTQLADAASTYGIATQELAWLNSPNNPDSIPVIQEAETQALAIAKKFDGEATAREGTIGKAEQDLAEARTALHKALREQWQTSMESVAANNVVDGLELRRRWVHAHRRLQKTGTPPPFRSATPRWAFRPLRCPSSEHSKTVAMAR